MPRTRRHQGTRHTYSHYLLNDDVSMDSGSNAFGVSLPTRLASFVGLGVDHTNHDFRLVDPCSRPWCKGTLVADGCLLCGRTPAHA